MTPDNKTIVAGALTGLVESGDVNALASTVHDDFIHHRPDGPVATEDEWLTAVAAVPLQNLEVEIVHILGDSDVVAVYSHRQLATGGRAIAAVDIWRLDQGLIAEGWEIIEPIDEASSHETWWSGTPSRTFT